MVAIPPVLLGGQWLYYMVVDSFLVGGREVDSLSTARYLILVRSRESRRLRGIRAFSATHWGYNSSADQT